MLTSVFLCFLTAFFAGFPVGPGSLEMLRLLERNEKKQALLLATGLALAGALWALFALVGIFPEIFWPGIKSYFFLFSGLFLMYLGIRPRLRGKKIKGSDLVTEAVLLERGVFFAFLKGLLIGLAFPLTVTSWVVALGIIAKISGSRSAFKDLIWQVVYFLIVFTGYFLYLLSLKILYEKKIRIGMLIFKNRLKIMPTILMLASGLILIILAIQEMIFRKL